VNTKAHTRRQAEADRYENTGIGSYSAGVRGISPETGCRVRVRDCPKHSQNSNQPCRATPVMTRTEEHQTYRLNRNKIIRMPSCPIWRIRTTWGNQWEDSILDSLSTHRDTATVAMPNRANRTNRNSRRSNPGCTQEMNSQTMDNSPRKSIACCGTHQECTQREDSGLRGSAATNPETATYQENTGSVVNQRYRPRKRTYRRTTWQRMNSRRTTVSGCIPAL